MDLIDNKEVCKMFKIHRSTLWNWIKAGKFPKPMTMGKKLMWDRETVYKHVRERGNNNAS